MEIKRILWPTDFSGNAEKAIPYVESLTRQYDYINEEKPRNVFIL